MPENIIITIAKHKTPLGNMISGFTPQGLVLLSFSDLDAFSLPLALKGTDTSFETNQQSKHLQNQLNSYFAGELQSFDIPLDAHGTDFQKRVWNELMNVPYGKTATYKEQTAKLGDPKAIRAVASANGANPIAIVVPCHRIIGSNNSLTGYAGELWRKKELLALESNQLNLF